MTNENFIYLEGQIGYQFKNRDLLQQAFTRRSFSEENGGENNEVLEFIGDKVLDIIIVKLLVKKYGWMSLDEVSFDKGKERNQFKSKYSEGKLTELKNRLVESKTLAKCIEELGIQEYLLMGKGDIEKNIQNEDSVKEDLLEAILGAVAQDAKWDFDILSDIVDIILSPETLLDNNFEDNDNNYVKLVQQWFQKKFKKSPNYEYLELNKTQSFQSNDHLSSQDIFFSSYNKDNDKYSCSLVIPLETNKKFVGYGSSKHKARMVTSELTYKFLEDNNLLFSIRDEIGEPSREMAINQLEILARRGYFSLPKYEFKQEYDDNGNPTWVCKCNISEYDQYFISSMSTKKEAKKSAAYDFLLYVLEYDAEDCNDFNY